jgi:gluconate 2-dehydrogenase alpha chain
VIRLKEREVVIVGGGLTAGLLARRLVPAGRDVLVLERGPDRAGGPEEELPSQRDDLRWNTHRGLTQRENVETLTLRHKPDEQALPMRRLTSFLPGYGVGGAISHWNGQTWRFQTTDYVLRSHLQQRYGRAALPADMTVQDWGVKYDDLEPYYTLFEQLFAISGEAGNLKGVKRPEGNPFEPYRSAPYSLPPLEPTEFGLMFRKAAASLGYHPFPMPAANASRAHRNPDGMQLGACQYCGHCERFICEAKAKSSAATLLFPLVAGRKNFEMRGNAEVLRLVYDKAAKRVTGVIYADALTGEEYEQPAGTVVLGAYVFTNTRLLLLSGIGKPYDPKTGEGAVGRNYCYQTTSAVQVFFEDRYLNPFMGAGALGTTIDDFNNDHFDHTGLGFHGGAYITANHTNGRPIDTRPLPPGTPRWGTRWKEANAKWYLRGGAIGCHGTSYSHRDNYLDLDPDYRDAWGRPLVRMTFDFPENDLKMSQYVTAKAHDIAKAMGATIINPAPRRGPYDARPYQSTHNTGGTIMGADAATSVVSPRLQCWDASNLFISGASVFPQNSGYNPTGPVGALGLRLGDDLMRYLDRPRFLG